MTEEERKMLRKAYENSEEIHRIFMKPPVGESERPVDQLFRMARDYQNAGRFARFSMKALAWTVSIGGGLAALWVSIKTGVGGK